MPGQLSCRSLPDPSVGLFDRQGSPPGRVGAFACDQPTREDVVVTALRADRAQADSCLQLLAGHRPRCWRRRPTGCAQSRTPGAARPAGPSIRPCGARGPSPAAPVSATLPSLGFGPAARAHRRSFHRAAPDRGLVAVAGAAPHGVRAPGGRHRQAPLGPPAGSRTGEAGVGRRLPAVTRGV